MMFLGGYYAFPGGQCEPGEEMTACAARELDEELGVRVEEAALSPVGRWVTPAFAPRRFDTCFFLAQCQGGAESPPNHSLNSTMANGSGPVMPSRCGKKRLHYDGAAHPTCPGGPVVGLDDIESRITRIPGLEAGK